MAEASRLDESLRRGLRKGVVRAAEFGLRAAMKIPGLNRVHPWLREDKSEMRWLPINADIELPEDAPLPLALLDRFIEEASHRVIIDYCGCREGWKCKHYPRDIGCLMMGDDALLIKRFPGREVGVEEARAHARRAVEAGLVPVVGKARVDNFIFDVRDRSRMLTTCFCCECCCITRYTRYTPAEWLDPIQPVLEGLTITVGDACTGCGKCVRHCYISAIEVRDGRAVIGKRCRACGRCAAVCPEGAISIAVDDPQFLEKAYAKIRAHVKFD
ncbi:MAG: 4Fe-4S binding protein [Actinomycetota bacterium]|nr:4Fe-4S binding protein [Actinomycetota bacterium]